MERRHPHLSSPITLGRTTFRNRMFSAPMGGTDIANDGCIGPKSTAFYELRGKGGAQRSRSPSSWCRSTNWASPFPFRYRLLAPLQTRPTAISMASSRDMRFPSATQARYMASEPAVCQLK